MPWFFIQLRYMKPFLSAAPNHWAERSGRFASDIDFSLTVAMCLPIQDFVCTNALCVRDLFSDGALCADLSVYRTCRAVALSYISYCRLWGSRQLRDPSATGSALFAASCCPAASRRFSFDLARSPDAVPSDLRRAACRSITRCNRQNAHRRAPITMRVHHELSVPSNVMSVWMVPRMPTPKTEPIT